MSNILTGTILWFDPVKGYGFIKQDNNQEDIFVHFRNIKTINNKRVEPKKGQKIYYELEDGEKGLHAINVSLI